MNKLYFYVRIHSRVSENQSHTRVVNWFQIVFLCEDSKEAAEIFLEAEFHALPVVDADEKLVGIVTTTDLIKYLLEQY